jgi:hypothetical protein
MYLLSFNLERGRMYRTPGLGRTLRAAALTQLFHQGLVVDQGGLAVPGPAADGTGGPTAAGVDGLSKGVYDELVRAGGPPRPWAHWVDHERRRAVPTVRGELTAAGWVDPGPWPDGLPIRGATTVSVSPPDRQTVRVLHRQVGRAIRGEIAAADLSWELAALVALGAAGRVITLISARERRTWPERIAELTRVAGPAALALARSR